MARTEPEMTDDGRYIIVKGRRWRATDPSIPASLKDELVHELMSARRAIKDGDSSARSRVNAAKIALGERGEPWWEPTGDGQLSRAVSAADALLRGRRGEPVHVNEVAQVAGGEQWRDIVTSVEDALRAQQHEQHWEVQNDERGLSIRPGPDFDA